MCGPREFEEGMSGQDIEKFRAGQGMPTESPEDDEICGDSDSWLNDL